MALDALDLYKRSKPNKQRKQSEEPNQISDDLALLLCIVERPTVFNVSKQHRKSNYESAGEKRKNQKCPEICEQQLPEGAGSNFEVHVGVTGIEPATSSNTWKRATTALHALFRKAYQHAQRLAGLPKRVKLS